MVILHVVISELPNINTMSVSTDSQTSLNVTWTFVYSTLTDFANVLRRITCENVNDANDKKIVDVTDSAGDGNKVCEGLKSSSTYKVTLDVICKTSVCSSESPQHTMTKYGVTSE